MIDMYDLAHAAINLAPVGTPRARITALTMDPVVMALVMAAFEMGQRDAEETVKPTSTALQEAFDEGYDEGRSEGYDEGRADGLDVGRAEGHANTDENTRLIAGYNESALRAVREMVNAENDALAAAEYKRGFEDGQGSK